MYNYQDDEVTELRKEIEQLKTGNRLHLELAEIKEAEIERLREALRLEKQLRNSALDLANDVQNQLNIMKGYTWSVVTPPKEKE